MQHIVLGHHKDQHAIYMMEEMKRKGHEVHLLETHDFPRKVQLAFSPSNGDGSIVLKDGTRLNLNDIQSVYWRNFCGVSDESTRENFTTQDDIAARDSMACIRTWFELNNNTLWANSWKAFQHHQEKPLQLWKVKQLGVLIPNTLVGNDIEQIKSAYQNVEKSIFKPVFGGAQTEILTDEHLESSRVSQALSKAPITVQEYIEGTNIRTYVIGNKVISAELRSDCADFREDQDMEIITLDTPHHIQEQSRQIAKELHLNWTAIDWRRDKHGNYYFLEANPSPMFLGFQHRSGIPISEYLIDMMTQNSKLKTLNPQQQVKIKQAC
ncbi:ATP-grasp domain-containing protein [Aliiglaciecola litoralis]|uniref:ATP-grasp domain-containing protein n=1 Tax=Aliiglaciecola litoralis TaxID=582857 RepID=A0ABP3WT02_9ALTE